MQWLVFIPLREVGKWNILFDLLGILYAMIIVHNSNEIGKWNILFWLVGYFICNDYCS